MRVQRATTKKQIFTEKPSAEREKNIFHFLILSFPVERKYRKETPPKGRRAFRFLRSKTMAFRHREKPTAESSQRFQLATPNEAPPSRHPRRGKGLCPLIPISYFALKKVTFETKIYYHPFLPRAFWGEKGDSERGTAPTLSGGVS